VDFGLLKLEGVDIAADLDGHGPLKQFKFLFGILLPLEFFGLEKVIHFIDVN
jgi:hypothetical protein